MEPLSFLLVTVSALAAYATKGLINRIATLRETSHKLEITTASGERVTIDASKLTREKAAEIAESHSTVQAAL